MPTIGLAFCSRGPRGIVVRPYSLAAMMFGDIVHMARPSNDTSTIDGVPVRMLIDTGATEVCVSASTARRLGVSPSGGRKRLIQTANGQSAAYPTILSTLSLDGLYMNDVEALILAPEAGEVNLLGASMWL